MNVYRNDGVSLPQLCERRETGASGKSTKRRGRLCGTGVDRDVDTELNMARAKRLPHSNYAAHASRASFLRRAKGALYRTSKPYCATCTFGGITRKGQ